MAIQTISEFGWSSTEPGEHQLMLLPAIRPFLATPGRARTLLDLGCGNGWLSAQYAALGYAVTGCDVSQDGLRLAAEAFPDVVFRRLSAYEDLRPLAPPGGFAAIVCSEVIEHLIDPAAMLANTRRVLANDGVLILTTPYHGYLKNLAISLANGWDRHFSVGHRGGHIKFFSPVSLRDMLRQNGFEPSGFRGAGRLPWLWKSMVLAARPAR
ncbi:MAG: class I SAM-dependent methyltransferase [Reyranellaceae bacterium]